eukprot:115186_1
MLLKPLSIMLCMAMVNAPDPDPGSLRRFTWPTFEKIITTIGLVGLTVNAVQLVQCMCNHQDPALDPRSVSESVHASRYPDPYVTCEFIGGILFPIARDGFCKTLLPTVVSMDYCHIPITKTHGNPHLALTVAAACRHPDIDISGPSDQTGITLEGLRNPEFPLWTKWNWVTGIDLSGNQDITTLRGTRNQNLKNLHLNNIDMFQKDAFVSMADELVNLEELQLRNCKGLKNIDWKTMRFPSELKILNLMDNALNVDTVRWLFKKATKNGFDLLFSLDEVIMSKLISDWIWMRQHFTEFHMKPSRNLQWFEQYTVGLVSASALSSEHQLKRLRQKHHGFVREVQWSKSTMVLYKRLMQQRQRKKK